MGLRRTALGVRVYVAVTTLHFCRSMSLCVIAAGLPENLFALAVGLLCLGLGFAGSNVARIVVVSVRRTLRCAAIAGAVYAVGDAMPRAVSNYAVSMRDNMMSWFGLVGRIFAVQLDPPMQ
jgi:hypothetical protein